MATLPDYIVLRSGEFTPDGNNRRMRFPIELVPDAFVSSNPRFRAILTFTVDPDGANPHVLNIDVHPQHAGASLQRACTFTAGQYATVHVLLNTQRLWDPAVANADREITFFHQQRGPAQNR